jgi:DNA polymerase III subunit chi
MAARVDFYVLDSDADRARLVYACRLVEKVFLLAQTVYVHTDGAQQSASFDDLLWTFADRSFVPHELAGAGSDASVQIGHGAPQPAAVLVNLAAGAPEFYDRYERVAEVVDGHAERREQGRRRFAWYRAQGLCPETHTVSV